jgi:hydroxymethylpyrimidine pyrophosphatase-like HAD family hydrolase
MHAEEKRNNRDDFKLFVFQNNFKNLKCKKKNKLISIVIIIIKNAVDLHCAVDVIIYYYCSHKCLLNEKFKKIKFTIEFGNKSINITSKNTHKGSAINRGVIIRF